MAAGQNNPKVYAPRVPDGAFGRRVDHSTRGEPSSLLDLKIGDVVDAEAAPTFARIEDAFRIAGVVHTVESETVCVDLEDEIPLIDEAYQVDVPGKFWFVLTIQAGPRAAYRVRRFVAEKGGVAYWPRSYRVVRRGRGRKKVRKKIVRSLFTRYVLMHLPAEGRLIAGDPRPNQPFNAPFGRFTNHEAKFNGTGDFLKNSLGPIAVPAELVGRLIARERDGEFDDTEMKRGKLVSKWPAWADVGSIVQIKEGPFASFPGVVEETDEVRSRLKAAVMIFGRPTRIELELAQVDAVC